MVEYSPPEGVISIFSLDIPSEDIKRPVVLQGYVLIAYHHAAHWNFSSRTPAPVPG